MPGTQLPCTFLEDLQLLCGQGAVVGTPVRETGQTGSHGGNPMAGSLTLSLNRDLLDRNSFVHF